MTSASTKKRAAKLKAVKAEAAEEVGDEVPGAGEIGDDSAKPPQDPLAIGIKL